MAITKITTEELFKQSEQVTTFSDIINISYWIIFALLISTIIYRIYKYKQNGWNDKKALLVSFWKIFTLFIILYLVISIIDWFFISCLCI